MPTVLLIQPTQYGSSTHKPLKQKRIYLPGLALPLLAALAPENWTVKIRIEVVDDIDFDEEADIIGIGAMGHAVFRAIDIAGEYRKRGKTVFMGGYMASIFPEFVNEHCDSIIIGDGEISFPKLLRDFETSGKIEKIYNEQLSSLENIPTARYELLDRKKVGFMFPVQAGRGCPHVCTYCSIACIYKGKYLTRPLDDVMRDIDRIRDMGFKRFYLIDDNIASNPAYLMEFARRIKPYKMTWASQCTILVAKNDKLLHAIADAGCSILSLGIESLSQQGLDSFKKNWVRVSETEELLNKIQKAGIMPATEMIVGTDYDTPESLRETARFIIRNKIPVPKFYILTPLPGTEFYREMKKSNRLLHEDYQKYTAADCVFKPVNFSPEELEKAYIELYREVYTFRNILRRTILNPGFLKKPAIYLFAFFSNLVYKRSISRGDAPNIL